MSRPIRAHLFAVACGLALAAGLAGCDAFDGPPAIDAAPATVSELRIEPRALSVDTMAVAEGLVTIPLSIEADVEAGDRSIVRVAYAVQWQFECVAGRIDHSGEMEAVDGTRYAAAAPVEVRPGRRGAYRVTAWAVDAAGRPSNEVSGTFELRGTNLGPPVITAVEAPTQVRPPATLRFVVHVDDPDGLDHVARAEVDLPGSGTIPLSETDTAGNNVPCDGTYSASFGVPAGVEPGFVTLTFRAFDRDGAVSEAVPFTVEIVE